MKHSERPLLIGFAGSSGVGKTTLLERAIPRLEAEGLEVGVVKHASHGFCADRPGKDSHRLYAAGARAVALASRGAMAVFQRSSCAASGSEPGLDEALEALPAGLDVVLVEGFAWTAIPRFVIVKGGEMPRREHLESGPVIRIVRTREPAAAEVFDVPASAVEEVLRYVRRSGLRGGRGPCRGTAAAGPGPAMTGVISPVRGAFEHRHRDG